MFSIPPATTMSFIPVIMLCAPSMIDFMPEAHTLLMVVQGTLVLNPAKIAA